MSEALEKEEKGKQAGKLCVKCKVMFGNSAFQEKCSVCFKEDKKNCEDGDKDGREQQEEKGFSTPVRNSNGDEQVRRCELIQAPKKHAHNESEEESEEEEPDDSDLDVSQISQKEEEDKEESVSLELCDQPTEKVEPSLEKSPLVIAKRDPKRATASKIQLPQRQPLPKSLKRTYEQFSSPAQQPKGRCSCCQRRTGMLGTICSHCSLQFCNSHRLPQNHSCEVDFAGDFKKKRKEELESLRPKSKGKLAPI